MPFADLFGQETVKKILRKALREGRLPSSLLFIGPDELGMKKMAVVLAQALNCLQLDDDACGECSPCRAISRGNFPDVIAAGPERDRNKKTIGIDQILELRQLALMKPMIGRNRVFIIEAAEKMTPEAANALLKILEEPPPYDYFILITSNLDLILPTIQSRCRALPFKLLSPEDIERALLASGMPPSRARLAAVLADGSLERAINLDWEKILLRRRAAWELFRHLLSGPQPSVFLQGLASSRGDAAREDFEEFMGLFLSFFRDLFLLAEKGDDRLLLNPDLAEEMKELASRVEKELCLRGLEATQEVLSDLQRNLNWRLLASRFYCQLRSAPYV